MDTKLYIGSPVKARLTILEQGRVSEVSLEEANHWTLGRKTETNSPDIPLASPIAGREHGVLVCMSGNWYYLDKGSANGTYLNGVRIDNHYKETSQPQRLCGGDLMEIDGGDLLQPDERRVWLLFSQGTGQEDWLSHRLEEPELQVGGAGAGGLELPFLQEEIPYARLFCDEDRTCVASADGELAAGALEYELQDIVGNGRVQVNCRDVGNGVLLKDRDVILMDGQPLVYAGRTLYYRSQPGRVPGSQQVGDEIKRQAGEKGQRESLLLQVDIHTRKVPVGSGVRELLRGVKLQVSAGSLVAVLGTSGAGKTTLMNCMNGMDTKGVEGSICFDGIDLLKNYEQVKYRIGSVPQGNVINPVLTVRKELEFAAKKYLPADTTKQEQEQRVADTLRKLRLEAVQDNRISKCSGGEQKRVNIGVELVLDRQMLCLDEPDAGLDPQMKTELFEILRELAHNENKMIFVIIHDVSDISLFDQVILLTKVEGVGRLAFSGSPEHAEAFFGTGMKEAYGLLSSRPEYYVEKFAGMS